MCNIHVESPKNIKILLYFLDFLSMELYSNIPWYGKKVWKMKYHYFSHSKIQLKDLFIQGCSIILYSLNIFLYI